MSCLYIFVDSTGYSFKNFRFDLLYLILDRVDEDADRQLARHLVALYMEDQIATAGIDVLVSFQGERVRGCHLIFDSYWELLVGGTIDSIYQLCS